MSLSYKRRIQVNKFLLTTLTYPLPRHLSKITANEETRKIAMLNYSTERPNSEYTNNIQHDKMNCRYSNNTQNSEHTQFH